MKALKTIALVLVIIGALNWGLIGVLKFDLVATILGSMSAITRIVYILVGLSGIYMIIDLLGGKKKAPQM